MASMTAAPVKAANGATPSTYTWNFAFSDFLEREHNFGLNKNRPFCRAWQEGHCPMGKQCPDKHPPTYSNRDMVCKHWLRGLCKKGDNCEFEHEYNVRAHPICPRWEKTYKCDRGDDCAFQHPDILKSRKLCASYQNGFCALGPHCANRHVRRVICPSYLAGFCPNGRQCKEGEHPKWKEDSDLPKQERKIEYTKEEAERERERMRADKEAELGPMEYGQHWNDDGQGGRGGRGRGRGRGRYGGRKRDY